MSRLGFLAAADDGRWVIQIANRQERPQRGRSLLYDLARQRLADNERRVG